MIMISFSCNFCCSLVFLCHSLTAIPRLLWSRLLVIHCHVAPSVAMTLSGRETGYNHKVRPIDSDAQCSKLSFLCYCHLVMARYSHKRKR